MHGDAIAQPRHSCDINPECPPFQDDQEQQGVKVHRVERSQSFVRRSLRLPEYADLSKVQVGVCSPCGYAHWALPLQMHRMPLCAPSCPSCIITEPADDATCSKCVYYCVWTCSCTIACPKSAASCFIVWAYGQTTETSSECV